VEVVEEEDRIRGGAQGALRKKASRVAARSASSGSPQMAQRSGWSRMEGE
jgi:hypothetical protein